VRDLLERLGFTIGESLDPAPLGAVQNTAKDSPAAIRRTSLMPKRPRRPWAWLLAEVSKNLVHLESMDVRVDPLQPTFRTLTGPALSWIPVRYLWYNCYTSRRASILTRRKARSPGQTQSGASVSRKRRRSSRVRPTWMRVLMFRNNIARSA